MFARAKGINDTFMRYFFQKKIIVLECYTNMFVSINLWVH